MSGQSRIGELDLDESCPRRAVVIVPVSSEIARHLEELALMGLWGVTPGEVAQRMIEHCTRALVADGTLKVQRPRPAFQRHSKNGE